MPVYIQLGIALGEQEQVWPHLAELKVHLVLALGIVYHLNLPAPVGDVHLHIVESHLIDGPAARGVAAHVPHVGLLLLAVFLLQLLEE